MFETGVRQLRMALSMVTRPAHRSRATSSGSSPTRSATLAAFGSPGDDVQQLLDGPFADPTAAARFQEQALRRTARRLARRSPHYRALFGATGVDAAAARRSRTLAQVPLTTKRDLVEHAADFLVDGARPHVTTRTTGTTGRPAEVWLSRYEIELWPALAALQRAAARRDPPRRLHADQHQLARDRRGAAEHDVVPPRRRARRGRSASSPPTESLDSLLTGGERAPTLLATYPSYLAELVKAARRRGLGPDDFRLRRIDCGGEVLSRALAARPLETLGARRQRHVRA